MSGAYRDDHTALRDVAQHLGIAAELLRQFEWIPRRVTGTTREDLDQLAYEARVAWEGLWDQLGQARALARGLGRNVAAYDRARAAAADIWLAACELKVGGSERVLGGYRYTIVWKHAPVQPAREAITALRRAVPEAGVLTMAEPPATRGALAPSRSLAGIVTVLVCMLLLGWCATH